MIRLAMILIGISRCGFLLSSAVVETASKPINAKKTMAAPLMTPAKPFGTNGCQFVGFTTNAPKAIKKTTTATLMITIIVFAAALSRVLLMSNAVIAVAISSAGMLMAIEWPAITEDV